MAERRMLAKAITDSDEFTSLSSAAQALYMHLNLGADDDGFNNQVQLAMFKAHAAIDDLRVLFAKKYIMQFDGGVIVIRHWKMNNLLRSDRKKSTNYQEFLNMLQTEEDGSYTPIDNQLTTKCQPTDNQLTTKCQPTDNQVAPQDRLGKYRLVEDSIVKDSIGENRENEEELDNNIPPISPLTIETVSSVIKGYTQNPTIRGLLREFVELRQKKRKPLTARAMRMALNKLDELAGDDGQKEEIIKQTILHAWDSFYRITEEYRPKGESRQKSLEEQVRENEERLRRKGII